MKTYKWLNQEIGTVAVIDDDGISRTSGLASSLVPEGAEILPADPTPAPTVQEQIAAIEAQFTTTLQMRVSLQEPEAITQVQGMYTQIAALKAQL